MSKKKTKETKESKEPKKSEKMMTYEEFDASCPGYSLSWWISKKWKLSFASWEEDGTLGLTHGPFEITSIKTKTLKGGEIAAAKEYYQGRQYSLLEINFGEGEEYVRLQPRLLNKEMLDSNSTILDILKQKNHISTENNNAKIVGEFVKKLNLRFSKAQQPSKTIRSVVVKPGSTVEEVDDEDSTVDVGEADWGDEPEVTEEPSKSTQVRNEDEDDKEMTDTGSMDGKDGEGDGWATSQTPSKPNVPPWKRVTTSILNSPPGIPQTPPPTQPGSNDRKTKAVSQPLPKSATPKPVPKPKVPTPGKNNKDKPNEEVKVEQEDEKEGDAGAGDNESTGSQKSTNSKSKKTDEKEEPSKKRKVDEIFKNMSPGLIQELNKEAAKSTAKSRRVGSLNSSGKRGQTKVDALTEDLYGTGNAFVREINDRMLLHKADIPANFLVPNQFIADNLPVELRARELTDKGIREIEVSFCQYGLDPDIAKVHLLIEDNVLYNALKSRTFTMALFQKRVSVENPCYAIVGNHTQAAVKSYAQQNKKLPAYRKTPIRRLFIFPKTHELQSIIRNYGDKSNRMQSVYTMMETWETVSLIRLSYFFQLQKLQDHAAAIKSVRDKQKQVMAGQKGGSPGNISLYINMAVVPEPVWVPLLRVIAGRIDTSHGLKAKVIREGNWFQAATDMPDETVTEYLWQCANGHWDKKTFTTACRRFRANAMLCQLIISTANSVCGKSRGVTFQTLAEMAEYYPSYENHLSQDFFDRCLRPGHIYKVGGSSLTLNIPGWIHDEVRIKCKMLLEEKKNPPPIVSHDKFVLSVAGYEVTTHNTDILKPTNFEFPEELSLVYQDSPYNILPPETAMWDSTPWTPTEQRQLIDQVTNSLHSKIGITWVMWAAPFKMGDFAKCFIEKKWEVTGPYIWFKPTYTAPVNSNLPLFATESYLVATLGPPPAHHYADSINPYDRQNHITMQHVTTHSKDENGSDINVCEKPVPLAMKIIRNFSPVGSTVLVVGSGSGSEVIAGLEENRKMIAVELDSRQFKAANNRIDSFVKGNSSKRPYGGDQAFAQVAGWLKQQNESTSDHKEKKRGKHAGSVGSSSPSSQSSSSAISVSDQNAETMSQLFALSQIQAVKKCRGCDVKETAKRPVSKCIHCDANVHTLIFLNDDGVEEPPCSFTCPTCLKDGLCSVLGCFGKCPLDFNTSSSSAASGIRALLELSSPVNVPDSQ